MILEALKLFQGTVYRINSVLSFR